MWLRIFTLEEARALLPEVRRLAEGARTLHDAWKAAAEQRDDLVIVWGDAVHDPDCEGHAEFAAQSAACDRARTLAEEAVAALEALGVQMKGIDMGLVDFPALQGDRLVYLCWRIGEPDIQAWHPLHGGFAARKPLPGVPPPPAP